MLSNKKAIELFTGIKNGDRNALARSITMVESARDDHQNIAEEILELCIPLSGNSIRIGITGVPGVGKSTFIESFGKYLIEHHDKKVAVIAVDPSSTKYKGSILGDKTRMAELSSNDKAFIRPSPSSGNLGGIGLATRECIMLFEAAGYDVILVETVGVGQSETEVEEIVDFFMLLMLPGAGDELQGIKRGIIELADAIFINKADGDNISRARQAQLAYTSALHLFPPAESDWMSKVELCSALEGKNLDRAWEIIGEYEKLTRSNGYFESVRKNQLHQWFLHATETRILNTYNQKPAYLKSLKEFEFKVLNAGLSPRKASRLLIESLSST
ncbi:MAG TPA: methylmalonyl Co-A mutase-associated GTPase MeaB [Flavobacteriales bacterium]|nr:methylmalonyl Co-A mutase-associated GTPase MeaB [Flavobacteriales bacterium]